MQDLRVEFPQQEIGVQNYVIIKDIELDSPPGRWRIYKKENLNSNTFKITRTHQNYRLNPKDT